MTVTFSVATSDFVILGADAAVSLDFSTWREYDTGRKLFLNGDVIVTAWGARDANLIAQVLQREHNKHLPVDELAQTVLAYLKEEYDPREMGLGTLGYHIGGFDVHRRPRLFHVFWEPEGYNATSPAGGLYEMQDQSPSSERQRVFLYNGRSDLAHTVVSSLLSQLKDKLPLKFDLARLSDMWRFTHLVLRFASELTPEVGPPLFIAASTASGPVLYRRYDTWEPILSDDAVAIARELDQQ